MNSLPSVARERRVVAALSLTEIVSWGILYYAFGVMVTPMQAELGWSQGLLGGCFSLALFVSAWLAVPIGRWLDRNGPRGVMTAGSLAGSVLVCAWSWVESPIAFLGLCLALGFPLASTLYEAAFAALVGLIDEPRRRDRALLVLTVVAGLASTAFVPLAQALVAEHGWRAALRILALLLGLGTIPLHALVLPGPFVLPGPRDARPAGGAPAPTSATPPPGRRLHLTAAAFACATLAGTSLGVYLVPILLEQGFTAGFAAAATGLIGVGQVLGRIAFTVLRTRTSLAAWSVALFLPGAIALPWLAARPPGAFVWAAVMLFSLSAGAQTLGRATWALELFELRIFARVNGVLGRWSLIGRAAAPLAIGALHDACGSHGPGLVAMGLLFAAGGVCARLAARD